MKNEIADVVSMMTGIPVNTDCKTKLKSNKLSKLEQIIKE